MRKFALLAITAIATLIASLLLPVSPASADGDTVITIGPGQYTGGFSHPTGTLSVSGGTISARCTASAAKGNSFLSTPSCVTRIAKCPVTAAYCTMTFNVRESALRGPVGVSAAVLIASGSFVYLSSPTPYNCPQANSCGFRQNYLVSAGSQVQVAPFNWENPNYPVVFGQLEMTAH